MPVTNEYKNPVRMREVRVLEEAYKKNKAPLWKRVANELEEPRRLKREINISVINKYSKDGENLIVLGKVLGRGELDHKVVITAFGFSESAKKKIEASKSRILGMDELIKKNPEGSNIKLIG